MPNVKIGDINMYYEVHGAGEPLVMIPGLGTNTGIFNMQIPAFSREYQVVVLDNRGAGRTDAPDIPCTIKMMADDLAGLLDAIDINSAHILGVSMGGAIAQELALNYPQKVKSLILACISCGGPHSVVVNDPEVLAIFQPSTLPLEEDMMKNLPFMISKEYIDKNPASIKKLIEEYMKYPPSPQGQTRQAQAVFGFNTYERLPEIKAPTLVIQGDADRVIPVENARILTSRINNAELEILEKKGHLFICEASDESNRIMLDFLKRHR